MTDRVSRSKRSDIMRSVRSKNTGPELRVRKLLFHLGFRFRLHRRDLPGTPDIVFPGRRKIIFVHGCFWHGHKKCRFGKLPKSRVSFWSKKIERNIERDAENINQLKAQGWEVLVVWQCELKNENHLKEKLIGFLNERTKDN